MVNIKIIKKQWKHFPLTRENIIYIVSGEILIFLIWIVCYRDLVWFAILQPLLILTLRYQRIYMKKRRLEKCKRGFLNLLQSLMTSLQAGYTLENACIATYKELEKLYQGQKHPILDSFSKVIAGIKLQIPIEKLFAEFAKDTGVEEIYEFSVVMQIAADTGGNVVEIIRNAMMQLQTKLETEQEIKVMLSGKIYEKNIMLAMPFMILLYLSMVNPDYISIFYQTLGGHALMTGLLIIIMLCFIWTEKIMQY